MTLIIEDGNIIANSNSYVTTTQLQAYADARGITIAGDLEELLVTAMDYIEGLNYIGLRQTRDQSLSWPRYDVYIDGWLQATTTIPQELKNGQMAVALAIDAGNGPLNNVDPQVRRKKVDVLEIEYAPGASSTVIVKTINNALRKLLNGVVGANTFKVSKA